MVLVEDNGGGVLLLHHPPDLQNEPDTLVLDLDLNLPKFSGLAVLRKIREIPNISHLRVVMLAGTISPGDREEVVKLNPRLIGQAQSLLGLPDSGRTNLPDLQREGERGWRSCQTLLMIQTTSAMMMSVPIIP